MQHLFYQAINLLFFAQKFANISFFICNFSDYFATSSSKIRLFLPHKWFTNFRNMFLLSLICNFCYIKLQHLILAFKEKLLSITFRTFNFQSLFIKRQISTLYLFSPSKIPLLFYHYFTNYLKYIYFCLLIYLI